MIRVDTNFQQDLKSKHDETHSKDLFIKNYGLNIQIFNVFDSSSHENQSKFTG